MGLSAGYGYKSRNYLSSAFRLLINRIISPCVLEKRENCHNVGIEEWKIGIRSPQFHDGRDVHPHRGRRKSRPVPHVEGGMPLLQARGEADWLIRTMK